MGQLQPELYRHERVPFHQKKMKRDCVRLSLLSVLVKRGYENSGIEIRWGSGVTHSAHALKCPTHTHLWHIMGSCCHAAHAELSFRWSPISYCTSFGLLDSHYFILREVLSTTQIVPHLNFPDQVTTTETCPGHGDLTIWRIKLCLYTHTHTWCSFTLEYSHWAKVMCLWVLVYVPRSVRLLLFTWRALTPSPTLSPMSLKIRPPPLPHTHVSIYIAHIMQHLCYISDTDQVAHSNTQPQPLR